MYSTILVIPILGWIRLNIPIELRPRCGKSTPRRSWLRGRWRSRRASSPPRRRSSNPPGSRSGKWHLLVVFILLDDNMATGFQGVNWFPLTGFIQLGIRFDIRPWRTYRSFCHCKVINWKSPSWLCMGHVSKIGSILQLSTFVILVMTLITYQVVNEGLTAPPKRPHWIWRPPSRLFH